MTRTQKWNNKNYAGIAEGTAMPQETYPKFFARNGFEGVDPKKTKKNGGGKGNWGGAGEEIVDEDEFHFTQPRRRSNSFGYSNHLKDFKTKFEINEPEPVFEESIHGPEAADDDDALSKTETSSSTGSSMEDKEHKHD